MLYGFFCWGDSIEAFICCQTLVIDGVMGISSFNGLRSSWSHLPINRCNMISMLVLIQLRMTTGDVQNADHTMIYNGSFTIQSSRKEFYKQHHPTSFTKVSLYNISYMKALDLSRFGEDVESGGRKKIELGDG